MCLVSVFRVEVGIVFRLMTFILYVHYYCGDNDQISACCNRTTSLGKEPACYNNIELSCHCIYFINFNALTFFHSVKSFTELAPQLLMLPDVQYLLSEVFSQDSLERYFSRQRHRGGSNDCPTAHQAPYNAATLVQQQWVYHELKSINAQTTENNFELQTVLQPLPKRPRRAV